MIVRFVSATRLNFFVHITDVHIQKTPRAPIGTFHECLSHRVKPETQLQNSTRFRPEFSHTTARESLGIYPRTPPHPWLTKGGDCREKWRVKMGRKLGPDLKMPRLDLIPVAVLFMTVLWCPTVVRGKVSACCSLQHPVDFR